MMKRPVSAVGYKRPLSQHARTSMMIRPEARYRVRPDVVTAFKCSPSWSGECDFRGLLVLLWDVHFYSVLDRFIKYFRICFGGKRNHLHENMQTLILLLLSQAENIVLLELDMPSRTTRDYEGPAIAPKVQAALEAALQDEDEIQVDASTFESTSNKKPKAR